MGRQLLRAEASGLQMASLAGGPVAGRLSGPPPRASALPRQLRLPPPLALSLSPVENFLPGLHPVVVTALLPQSQSLMAMARSICPETSQGAHRLWGDAQLCWMRSSPKGSTEPLSCQNHPFRCLPLSPISSTLEGSRAFTEHPSL